MVQIKKFYPEKDLVLIQPLAEEDEGGVIVPDVAKQAPQIGTIIETASNSPYKTGTIVLYRRWAGDEVKFANGTFILLSVEDILGAVEV